MSEAQGAQIARRRRDEKEFWREFPVMADYFGRAITSLQKYLGVSTKEIFASLGEVLGKKAAERYESSLSVESVLKSISHVLEDYEIGMLEIKHKDPLTLVISDCSICGQLAGSGENYDCVFHEGFFRSLLSKRLGREVNIIQETNNEGNAGTWCRRYVANNVELKR